MSFETIILLNLFIYLLGFALLLSLNNSVLGEISGWTSIFINILGVIFALSIQLNFGDLYTISYEWINFDKIHFNYKLLINEQTSFMFVLVQAIGVAVQLFSSKYLKNDPDLPRYFAYINLFIFAMLGLVLAGNLLFLYAFWELVGLCSFLLIGFWYEKPKAVNASLQAFLMNRVGDAFFMLGILLIYFSCKTIDFIKIENGVHFTAISGLSISAENLQTVSVLMIFVGVMFKSAQFPFHTWLPDAMEGPTPASALIHAATMVVAGVFLMARIAPLITEDAGFIMALIGSFTSVFAGFSAIFQYDIKKVLAYSTISQLGIMITAIGVGAVGASLFHLTTHAFFKAGLFLCAGAVINYCHHNQDMRKMGDLSGVMPVVYYSYFICGAALVGLPLTSGYLSKEAILNSVIAYGYHNKTISYKTIIPVFLGISMFITNFYIIRQFVMVFFERQESPIAKMMDRTRTVISNVVNTMTDVVTAENHGGGDRFLRFLQTISIFDFSVMAMAIGSTYMLFSSNPLSFEESWFMKTFTNPAIIDYDWLPYIIAAILLISLLISFNYTRQEIERFYTGVSYSKFNKKIFKLGYHNFYMDTFYEKTFSKLIVGIPNLSISLLFSNDTEIKYKGGLANGFKRFEQNVIDVFLKKIISGFIFISVVFKSFEVKIIDDIIHSITESILFIGKKLRTLQGGNIQKYLLSLILFVLTLLIVQFLFR